MSRFPLAPAFEPGPRLTLEQVDFYQNQNRCAPALVLPFSPQCLGSNEAPAWGPERAGTLARQS